MRKKTETSPYSKYMLIILLSLIGILAYYIVKPFLISIISSCLVAYLLYPLFRICNDKIKYPGLTTLLLIALIGLIAFFTLTFTATAITKQLQPGIKTIYSFALELNDQDCEMDKTTYACKLIQYNQKYNLDQTFADLVSKVANYILAQASAFLISIPAFALQLFVFLFITYYLIKDGPKTVDKITDLISLKTRYKTIILKRMKDIIFASIHGQFFSALAQGIAGAIGFLIFGFPSPLTWGFFTAIAALIPFIGTAIIWVPAASIKLLVSIANKDTSGIISTSLFFVYGIFIIGGIDNIIKPKLIGTKSQIHPVIILLGVLGGVTFLKIPGLILGPLILSIFITLIELLNKEMNNNATKSKKARN